MIVVSNSGPLMALGNVIVQGYRMGLLRFDELETVIEAIMTRDDIWISDGLCREVMARLKNPSLRE